MKQLKLIAPLFAILLIAGILLFWTTQAPAAPNNSKTSTVATQKPKVIASFVTIADFVHAVGGDLIEIDYITPSSVEPHHFEPNPQDIVKVNAADIFVYNGFGLDPWAQKIASELTSPATKNINMSEFITPRKIEEEHEDEGEFDPHFWLNPTNAILQVEKISETLVEIDPQNADTYVINKDNYIAQLRDLDQDFETQLKTCKLRKFVTAHDAFGYMADRYNLEPVHISGISPEEEPTPKTMAEIADLVKKDKIEYIFFETLTSPKLSQTLASETGATTLVLNPIEGLSENEQDMDYVSIMRQNLTNLTIALKCEPSN